MKDLLGFEEDGSRRPHMLGHFFLAIDIDSFTDLAAFKETTGRILRALRASRKAAGQDRIYTCGEKEHLEETGRGGIPLGRELQRQILAMRDELGLTRYRFEFEPVPADPPDSRNRE